MARGALILRSVISASVKPFTANFAALYAVCEKASQRSTSQEPFNAIIWEQNAMKNRMMCVGSDVSTPFPVTGRVRNPPRQILTHATEETNVRISSRHAERIQRIVRAASGRNPYEIPAFCVFLLIVGLLAASAPRVTLAQSPAYHFTSIATLNEPAPGGGNFINDFEPWSINSSGDIAFVADLSTGGEGIFVDRDGQKSQIMRTGQSAPGGGTFAGGSLASAHP